MKKNEHPAIAEMKGLINQLEHFPFTIEADEWIVGDYPTEPITFHYGSGISIDVSWIDRIMRDEQVDSSYKEQAQYYSEQIKPYISQRVIDSTLTPEEILAKRRGLVDGGFWGGHMVMDLESVLNKGIVGIQVDVEKYRERATHEQYPFYDALLMGCDYYKRWCERFQSMAVSKAIDASSIAEEEHFNNLAKILGHVPYHPPTSFLEAVQAAFFIHVSLGKDSLGRIDQYLYPSFKKDRENGTLSLEEASNILAHFYLKVFEQVSIQNCTIGGQMKSGEDACNELTELTLNLSARFHLPQPNFTLRVTDSTPDSIWDLGLQSIGKGHGIPAMINDAGYIKGLKQKGIEEEDAKDFALAGCMETVIPGCSHMGADDGNLNVLACLDLALRNGYSSFCKEQIGCFSGEPEEFQSVDDILSALKKQIDTMLKHYFSISSKADPARQQVTGYVLRSLLTRDCIPQGKSILEGGARYNAIESEIVGVTNTADALYVINEVVFRQKKMTLAQLIAVLDQNYQGCDELRQEWKHLPKFGNEVEEIRSYYRILADYIATAHEAQATVRGGSFWTGMIIFVYHESMGSLTPASPDGRMHRSVLADSIGPSQGVDRKGPTAVINDVLCFDQSRYVTTPVLNLKFAPTQFETKEQRMNVRALIRDYFKRGGMQVQINSVNREDLIKAQKDPELYKHLVVRVGGFSAFFVTLSEDVQEDIIARTEHNA